MIIIKFEKACKAMIEEDFSLTALYRQEQQLYLEQQARERDLLSPSPCTPDVVCSIAAAERSPMLCARSACSVPV